MTDLEKALAAIATEDTRYAAAGMLNPRVQMNTDAMYQEHHRRQRERLRNLRSKGRQIYIHIHCSKGCESQDGSPVNHTEGEELACCTGMIGSEDGKACACGRHLIAEEMLGICFWCSKPSRRRCIIAVS